MIPSRAAQDVSRLLDICRQSIYFETMAGVVDCLKAIGSDPDVVLTRVKNRYDLSFDAAASAGYRNLAVNLRVVTEETKALGLETHVCEVQLLLVHMAAIKVRDLSRDFLKFALFKQYLHWQCASAMGTDHGGSRA